ncbi:hypothetical protein NNO07_28325, partial [Pseudomonas resinovorans]
FVGCDERLASLADGISNMLVSFPKVDAGAFESKSLFSERFQAQYPLAPSKANNAAPRIEPAMAPFSPPERPE